MAVLGCSRNDLLTSIFISPLLLALFSVVVVVNSDGLMQPPVRGVELKLQSFYLPDKDFTCLDGSKSITFKAVNDNYCDCADGSDEPSTPACPHGQFYCMNIGHKARYIPSSRVNDGICDCCDGSDEYDGRNAAAMQCTDECEKLQIAEHEEKREKMAEMLEGMKVREGYIQAGKEKKDFIAKRIDAINELLEQRRKDLEAARAIKDITEKPEKEAKDKHHAEWEEIVAKRKAEEEEHVKAHFDLLDSDKDGWISTDELTSSNYLVDNLTVEEATSVLGGETMVSRENIGDVWHKIETKFKGRLDVTNFDASSIDSYPLQGMPGDPLKEMPPSNDDPLKEIPPSNNKWIDEEMPDFNEDVLKLIEAADKARRDFDTISKAVGELENEKKSLEDHGLFDFGPHEEFTALKDQCFELADKEYTYKLCLFDKVTQVTQNAGTETDLGNMMQWVDNERNHYSIMKYEGGHSCWNGPSRSTTVLLSCGKINELVSVSEPSRCEYKMSFKTPSLCKNNHDEL